MKRLMVLAVLVMCASSGFAQRSFQLRLGIPGPALGFGLEARLQRSFVANVYGDIFFNGPSFLLGASALFKSDLRQFDNDLRGIKPFLGAGLAMVLPNNPNFALTLDGGVEFEIDSSTGIFIAGQSLFFFSGGQGGRVVFGASFR
jgi:hypothetical protein